MNFLSSSMFDQGERYAVRASAFEVGRPEKWFLSLDN